MLPEIKRYYVHNGPARASLAMQHEVKSGVIVLALSFATTKVDRYGRLDVYSKKAARQILDKRFEDYMQKTVELFTVPPQLIMPQVLFIGFYDGNKSKNDIFGPLIDVFTSIGPDRGSVDKLVEEIHSMASLLLIQANHRASREDRKKVNGYFASQKILLIKLDEMLAELDVQIQYELNEYNEEGPLGSERMTEELTAV